MAKGWEECNSHEIVMIQHKQNSRLCKQKIRKLFQKRSETRRLNDNHFAAFSSVLTEIDSTKKDEELEGLGARFY